MTASIHQARTEIKDAPISESRVECNADVFAIYLDKRLEVIAPKSYKFLSLLGKENINITQAGACYSEKDARQMQKNILIQVAASLAVFVSSLAIFAYSSDADDFSIKPFPASMLSLPSWFLFYKLGSCANERIKAQTIDAIVTERATPEELKGGILFYKAFQQRNKKKNMFFYTDSGESRFSSLESSPLLQDRIIQLEQELKSRGIASECTKKDQQKIREMENLFYST